MHGVTVAGMTTRRTLRDWHAETDPPEEDWLAAQYDGGWQRDHLYGGRPSTVSIDSSPPVQRWAMVQVPDDGEHAG